MSSLFSALRHLVVCTLVVAAATALASPEASAAEMAGLKFETNGISSDLKRDLRAAVDSAFSSVDRWTLVDFSTARADLDPVARGCFTQDCLIKAGEATGAPAGLSVEVSGEAEIYNWTIQLWDLRSGEKLKTEKGTCELCGRAEVKRSFQAGLKAALAATGLPKRARADKEPSTAPAEEDETPSQVPLRVSVIPTEAEIYVDDQLAGQGDVTRLVGAGEHTVRFKMEGYGDLTETVIVNEDTEGPVILRVHLSRTSPEAVEVPVGVGPIDRLGEQRTTYGAIATGTGAVLLGTGIYLTSIDGETTCDESVPVTECPDVYATGGAGLTLGVLGTALVTGGVTLLTWELLAGDSDVDEPAIDSGEPADPTMSLSPSLGADGGGLLLRGTF